MIVIEGTVFAMAIATFLYLRTANFDWPPATVPKPDLLWPTINLILLMLSVIPANIADRGGARQDRRMVIAGMSMCVITGIVFLAIRMHNMANIGYKWSDHAFGSIVWVAVGLHTFHVFCATGENSLLLIYAAIKPMTKKRFLDFRCGAVYWYFVVISWLPFYFFIYVQPWMRRKG
jgi:heme/copper-type cytochrome/quinol oxidase subunit 3